ncbi:GSCOCG00008832001-RA-CDS [Cotesia congregata]|nr:GSCOCG00008832001-RA-CDS [Cotesia congregata]
MLYKAACSVIKQQETPLNLPRTQKRMAPAPTR